MSKQTNTSRLTEAAFMTGIMVIISLLGSFLFDLIFFVYPIPAIILAKKQDYKISILALIAAALIAFVLGLQIGLYYILLFSPLAATMAILISKNKKPFIVVITSAMVYIISFIIMIIILQVIMGISFVDSIKEIFTEAVNIQKSILGNFQEAQLNTAEFEALYNQLIEVGITIIPAVIISIAVFISVINYSIAYKLSKRLKIDIVPIKDFSQFKLPNNFLVGILIIIIGMWILKSLNYANYDNMYINIFYLALILVIVQGLSLIKYMFKKYNIKKGFGILIALLIFIMPILLYGIILLGISEIIFDFRRLRKRGGKK